MWVRVKLTSIVVLLFALMAFKLCCQLSNLGLLYLIDGRRIVYPKMFCVAVTNALTINKRPIPLAQIFHSDCFGPKRNEV